MSYRYLLYHLVFSTHARQRTISDKHDSELYAYLIGIIRNQGGVVRAVNGMPDHVHILLDIPPTVSVSDFIKKIKQSSSAWMRANRNFPYWDGWSKGYALFTCSPLAVEPVLRYVNNQKVHHKKANFEEELKEILRSAGIGYEEKDEV